MPNSIVSVFSLLVCIFAIQSAKCQVNIPRSFKTEDEYKDYLNDTKNTADYLAGIWKFTTIIGSGLKDKKGNDLMPPMKISSEINIAIIKGFNETYYCYQVEDFSRKLNDSFGLWHNLTFEETAAQGKYLFSFDGINVSGDGKAFITKAGDLTFTCYADKPIPNVRGGKNYDYFQVTAVKLAPKSRY